MFRYELGSVAKDKITGFEGVIRVRSEYLTGCDVYGLQSRELKENKPADYVFIDEALIELIRPDFLKNNGERIVSDNGKTGGPLQVSPPQR